MIVEGTIGDAYGAGFEFASKEVISQKNNLDRYIQHPLFLSIFKKYTDDTQMSLAIAELLISDSEWTPINIADKFVEVFKRDPREGYAKRFYKLLMEVKNGKELIKIINPESTRNGAAMRAYPLGVISDIDEIKEKAAVQASITHNTKEGILSAQAIALMAHFTFHQKGSLKELPHFLAEEQKTNWSTNWNEEVKVDGIQSVNAVLTMLYNHTGSMSNMLIESVNLSGDVDTVASLTLAIASNTLEVKNDLPRWLYNDIENDTYGINYIRNMDRQLKIQSK